MAGNSKQQTLLRAQILPPLSTSDDCTEYLAGNCQRSKSLCDKRHTIRSTNKGPVLCQSFLNGMCNMELPRCIQGYHLCVQSTDGMCLDNLCPCDHTWRLTQTGLLCPSNTPSDPNYLSLAYRPKLRTLEDSGPGQLSGRGFRHDNDHILIRDILILPTMDEILCAKPLYLPRKDLVTNHFLSAGASRHLDTQFRLLRYDKVQSIIDITYNACQRLVCNDKLKYLVERKTTSGLRYRMYSDLIFENLGWHASKGIEIQVSMACPTALRGWNISTKSVLERGMLVALVGKDLNEPALSTIFFEITAAISEEGMRSKGMGPRLGLRMCLAQPDVEDDYRRALLYSQSIYNGKFVLVEYPGVLLAGFMHTLKCLQRPDMSIPFEDEIAPQIPTRKPSPHSGPPAYALESGFSYDLNTLRRPMTEIEAMNLRLNVRFILDAKEHSAALIANQTTLDKGQASALVHCLSRSLAFTQGPPGTGKTYLGLALVRSILASRLKAEKWPIIVACMTNHALDAFLKDLMGCGVTNIVRLGSGSKEAWTKQINLLMNKYKPKIPDKEYARWRASSRRVEVLNREGEKICESLREADLTWHTVRDHLRENENDFYEQFAALDLVGGVNHSAGSAPRRFDGVGFNCWMKNVDMSAQSILLQSYQSYLGQTTDNDIQFQDIKELIEQTWNESKVNELLNSPGKQNIWKLSPVERGNLVAKWRSEISLVQQVEKLAEVHRKHWLARREEQSLRAQNEGTQLKHVDVIGLTTTGCAKYWELLQHAGPKVVICEEAGEVMEPHSLCTFSSTVEHAIFIGDPDQLRPHVTEPSLSMETRAGRAYRLDESLFERLSKPFDPNTSPIPTAKLNIQRRMFPDIANICRTILYPYLQDHVSTTTHPLVAGMAKRMFWLDHRFEEDRIDSGSNSSSNASEVQMIRGLTKYLISQHEYRLGEIAVLTPYSKQVEKLNSGLHARCSVYLDAKEKDVLLERKHIPKEVLDNPGLIEVDLSHMLRISTIDNFQGEEARVVIFSMVRSNCEGRIGFLKTANRVNVACSRARDGFYIIGNAELMSKAAIWAAVIHVFNKQACIGPSFEVQCNRHKAEESKHISNPRDFARIEACQIKCNYIYECGHECSKLCHSPSLHKQFLCQEPCQRKRECSHCCTKTCSEPCADCRVMFSDVRLPCGHVADITCAEQLTGSHKCTRIIRTERFPCGHTYDVSCSAESTEIPPCEMNCEKVLPCGHTCGGKCHDCDGINTTHPTCDAPCGRQLPCAHSCLRRCHTGDCDLKCEQPCKISCVHGTCTKRCHEECDPCLQPCDRGCSYQPKCKSICSLPCTKLPCSIKCSEVFDCGHECATLCDEVCLKPCHECITGEKSSTLKIGLECGHIFDVAWLDNHMRYSETYDIDYTGCNTRLRRPVQPIQSIPGCPTCGRSLLGIRRYTFLYKLHDYFTIVDRMYGEISRALFEFQNDLVYYQSELPTRYEWFCQDVSKNLLDTPKINTFIRRRGAELDPLLNRINEYCRKVVHPFEHGVKETTAYLGAEGNFLRPQLSFGLRLSLLWFRCRFTTASEGLKTLQYLKTRKDPSGTVAAFVVALQEVMKKVLPELVQDMNAPIAECQARELKSLETEFRLLQLSIVQCADEVRLGLCRDRTEVEASTARTELLIRTFPESAGKLKEAAEFILSHRVLKEGFLWPVDFARDLAKHTIGSIAYCERRHPFCGSVFLHCPECGPEKIPEADKVKKLGLRSRRMAKFGGGNETATTVELDVLT